MKISKSGNYKLIKTIKYIKTKYIRNSQTIKYTRIKRICRCVIIYKPCRKHLAPFAQKNTLQKLNSIDY